MALTPEIKVLLTLRYLATGKMQQCSSDDLGPSQPSVNNAIRQTLHALTHLKVMNNVINFPFNRHQLQQTTQDFCRISGFPGVVRVVDGTHVRIVAQASMRQNISIGRTTTA